MYAKKVKANIEEKNTKKKMKRNDRPKKLYYACSIA
jgi:hypothetical protein